MNKQELIEKLGERITNYKERAKDKDVLPSSKNTLMSRVYGLAQAQTLVEELEEIPLVTVPQFLDKYIQDNKGNSASDIFSQDWFHESVDETDDEVNKWLYDNDGTENDRRYLIAVQAFVTGEYEVEKEPLYYVIINKEYLVLMFTNRKDHRFIDKDELVEWHPSGYQLTEAEIKSIDKRYWPFAVPVEEVK